MSGSVSVSSLFADRPPLSFTRRRMLKTAVLLSTTGAMAGIVAACTDDDSPASAVDEDDDIVEDDDGEGDSEVIDDGLSSDDNAESEPEGDDVPSDEPQYGGTLNVATVGEPPTLDMHLTSSSLTMHMMSHVVETLFTWDSEFQVIPDLVDRHEVSDNGLTNTVHLRTGVQFHNGNELKSEDVIASINRWSDLVGFGQELRNATAEIVEVDDHTVDFEMHEPFGTFSVLLARQNNGCAIYPAVMIDEAGDEAMTEFVGTGPYWFVEHQPDRHLLLERFEDYSSRDEEPDGYGGRKHAYLDRIRFIPVASEASRVAGLQAGDYHYLDNVSTDHFRTLENDPNAVAALGPPPSYDLIDLNMQQRAMSDLRVRQAARAAMNPEEMLLAAYGEGNYRLDPGFMMPETVWHTSVGEELYNINDPDLARELLDESDYDGEEIHLITISEYQNMTDISFILQQQLADIGLDINLGIYDYPGWAEFHGDLSTWDVAINGFGFRVDPAQLPLMRCEWGVRWCSDEKVALVDQLFSAVEFEDRLDAWEGIQALIYEEIPAVMVGAPLRLLAHSPHMKNIGPLQLQPAYWNVWLDES
jgi:peptide/nickel transport system substrate-binding protein